MITLSVPRSSVCVPPVPRVRVEERGDDRATRAHEDELAPVVDHGVEIGGGRKAGQARPWLTGLALHEDRALVARDDREVLARSEGSLLRRYEGRGDDGAQ